MTIHTVLDASKLANIAAGIARAVKSCSSLKARAVRIELKAKAEGSRLLAQVPRTARSQRGQGRKNKSTPKVGVDSTTPLAEALEESGLSDSEAHRWAKIESAADKIDGWIDGCIRDGVDTSPTFFIRDAVNRPAAARKIAEIKKKIAAAPDGVYDVIVVDPPWPLTIINRDVRPNQVELSYPTMSEEELRLCDLVTKPLGLTTDCHVWLWTTHKFLPMALRLLGAWGLKYVCTFVWHKPGGMQAMNLPQYNCEFALYARKGSPRFVSTKAFSTCFSAPRGAHSEKPEEFYGLVRAATGGRRLDIFNRRTIEGFDGCGNETTS